MSSIAALEPAPWEQQLSGMSEQDLADAHARLLAGGEKAVSETVADRSAPEFGHLELLLKLARTHTAVEFGQVMLGLTQPGEALDNLDAGLLFESRERMADTLYLYLWFQQDRRPRGAKN